MSLLKEQLDSQGDLAEFKDKASQLESALTLLEQERKEEKSQWDQKVKFNIGSNIV
jgi:hypothetical protein